MDTLRTGSRGPDVELAQAALNYHVGGGKKIKVDGQFGSGTATRVIGFQQFHGLFVDGVIGEQTRKKLFQVKTFLFSGAILARPSDQAIRSAQNQPPRFPNMPINPFQTPRIDWSKLNWRQVPLWPTPPIPSTPWPQLTLTLPPFPQAPGLPGPPPPPRLVLNTPVPPGGTVSMPPPVFSPFNTPSAKIFMIKASVLSRDKNLKVVGELEPMLDDDGRTFKFSGLAKAEIDILDFGAIKAAAYAKIEAEAGIAPPTGKVTGSSGLKFTFLKGVVELATEVKVLKIDSEKGEIKAGVNALMMKATVLF